MRTKKWVTSAAILALLVVAGCSGKQTNPAPANTDKAPQDQSQPSQPKSGGTLIVAKDDEAPGLDPQKMPATSAIRIFELVYNGLLTLDADLKLQPSLADSWQITDEGKTYTFKLHPGVKFHNGREMTSADVKYSYDRMLDEQTGALNRGYFVSVIDKIETPDPMTVVFRLKAASGPFLNNTASVWSAIVAKEVVEENKGDLSRVAVGTGPFKLGEWVQDSHTVLNRFDDYFGGKALVDAVKFVVLKDEAARLAAIRTGQVHMTLVTSQSAERLKGEAGVKVVTAPVLRYYYLGMNHARKPFDDLKVRQAISLALDRQQLIDVTLGGEGSLTGPTPPSMKEWAVPGDKFPMNTYDVAKAKELLAQAGYPDGFETTLSSASTRSDFMDQAQLIQSQLAQVGIKAEIKSLEWSKYVDDWRKKDLDMMIGANGGGPDIDRSVSFYWASDGGANVWNFANKQVDDLVAKARGTADVKVQYEAYAEAQQIVVDQVANAFLAAPNKFLAMRNTVQDYTSMANDQNLYLTKTWLTDGK